MNDLNKIMKLLELNASDLTIEIASTGTKEGVMGGDSRYRISYVCADTGERHTYELEEQEKKTLFKMVREMKE